MQSFRTELENPLVEKDIIDLEKKIRAYREGTIDEEKFRSLRLARGVYGQRQQGVQMVRIKLPFGKLSVRQLLRIADISEAYSNGNLHLTTRQDIQIHHVSLDKTPELWAQLELDNITLREACGNTVRNITASPEAGIDPEELFDVSPYAYALFAYLLRKPFGQELGRKIKIAFSNTDKDTAFTYIHDLGFIPRINQNGERGFKVLIGGGLGAQPFLAKVAYEFLHENKLVPFVEAVIRTFDRHGERASRHKARLKYLVHKLGLDAFLALVSEQETALPQKEIAIDSGTVVAFRARPRKVPQRTPQIDQEAYVKWMGTNVIKQKQEGYYGVYLKIQLGNVSSVKARLLAGIIETYAVSDDFRITINQGFLLRGVAEADLPYLFEELHALGLAQPGFDSVADITACPGTDTCNLAISNSTAITQHLESVIYNEFPDLVYNHDIKIKISGCMNSCGQHGLAHIGFHGSSFKVGQLVIPAVQVLLGGGTLGNGQGRMAEKIIKVATKRAPSVLRLLFSDLEQHALPGEYFHAYYDRRGKDYFYQLLKPLADTGQLSPEEHYDWGATEKFETAIGVGECAGVVIDLVQTLFYEAAEKLQWSREALLNGQLSDSIYFSYAAFVQAAKAWLLDSGVHVNTHHSLISDFDMHFSNPGELLLHASFREAVLQINKREPSEQFAQSYHDEANQFVNGLSQLRAQQFLNVRS